MLSIRDDFRRSQVAIGALFLLLGFQYASWTSRLPTIKARLDLTDAEVGLLLMACGVGAAVSFPLVALLMRRLGSRLLCLASALGLGLLPLALAAAPDYPLALVVVCVDGVGVACLDVAMNAQGADLEARFSRTGMGKLHATFSAGGLFAALLASAISAATSSLTAHFAVVAGVVVLLLVLARGDLLTGSAADRDPEPEPAEGAKPERTGRKWPLPTRVTMWMGLAMALGTVVEGAMNDWSALYLKNIAHAAPSVTPMGIAVFSVMMVLARIFSDGWRSRWGDRRVATVGSALAGAGLLLAVLVGGVAPALLGFACVGLGVAAVTPCVYVAAAGHGADALALISAMGTVGLLAGPALIGFVADSSSLAWGMGAVAVAAVLVAGCAWRISWPAAAASADASDVGGAVEAESEAAAGP